jgi:hypothetical protein
MATKKLIRLKEDTIWADWKEVSPEFLNQLETSLKKFKLFVTDDPVCEGSDMYGVIISNRPLTSKELAKRITDWENPQ